MTIAIEKTMDELDVERLLSNQNVAVAMDEIINELARAERLHPVWPADPIHAVAIMMEEAGESVQAANDVVHLGAPVSDSLRKELIQTGAMVLRVLMHLEVEA